MITVTLPIRTVSESNRRDCWQARARRTKRARMIAGLALRIPLAGMQPPLTVTLTRISPGNGLDSDNLQASQKAVRDGIADALGVDDGHPGITWVVRQRRGKAGEYAVTIEVSP